MENKKKCATMSKIVILHYAKFIFRSLLFLSAFGIYLYNRICETGKVFGGLEDSHFVMSVLWCIFFAEMLLRFVPAKFESAGSHKQLARTFVKREGAELPERRGTWKGTFWAAFAWVILNVIITALYLTGVFDTGFMVLVAMGYSVCDLICILFFCPFQTWFLKNKCCVNCRIYNWDYAMMFTPFIFIGHFYTWSLLGMALVLLFHWEISYRLHPERFYEECNDRLTCAECTEKLCKHKRQFRTFLKKQKFCR